MDLKSLTSLYQIAFTHGRSWTVGEAVYHFSVSRAGILILSSGQVVACDPLFSGPRQPFIQNVLPGRYPVDLAIVRSGDEQEERIALARVMFTKNAPVVWVKAITTDGPDADEGPVGYTAATGTGAFMDAETAERFKIDSLAEVDRLLDALMANYRPVRNWLELSLDERHNVILFTSGIESGVYPSFFAVDAAGDICLLVTACWTEPFLS